MAKRAHLSDYIRELEFDLRKAIEELREVETQLASSPKD